MLTDITDAQIRDAAEAKILAKRDEILREQQENREKQALLATRDRELDRAMQECRPPLNFLESRLNRFKRNKRKRLYAIELRCSE